MFEFAQICYEYKKGFISLFYRDKIFFVPKEIFPEIGIEELKIAHSYASGFDSSEFYIIYDKFDTNYVVCVTKHDFEVFNKNHDFYLGETVKVIDKKKYYLQDFGWTIEEVYGDCIDPLFSK